MSGKKGSADKMYVKLENINKQFGNYKASDNISFEIEKGKLIGLLGPSGSGKTTILRMIAGLENPDSGDIFINGIRVNDIEPSKREIGFVFQNYALFRYMTVYDNIAFGLNVKKEDKKYIKERVTELIELIGLKGLEDRYPNQLSGGQKQRVAFARALAPNPKLLLLDEPFAAIDSKIRKELRSWLRSIIDKFQITSIFVTHDQDEAIEVADEIIVTNKGCIEQKGSPIEIYKYPNTPFVAQFIGESLIVENYSILKGFEEIHLGHNAVIRPEYVKVLKDKELNQYYSVAEKGIVEEVNFRGNNIEIKVRVKDILFIANRTLEEDAVSIGEQVNVLIYRIYVFNDEETFLLENSGMINPNPVFI